MKFKDGDRVFTPSGQPGFVSQTWERYESRDHFPTYNVFIEDEDRTRMFFEPELVLDVLGELAKT